MAILVKLKKGQGQFWSHRRFCLVPSVVLSKSEENPSIIKKVKVNYSKNQEQLNNLTMKFKVICDSRSNSVCSLQMGVNKIHSFIIKLQQITSKFSDLILKGKVSYLWVNVKLSVVSLKALSKCVKD